MKTYQQDGKTLTLTPAAQVLSGIGYLFGTALFGVAATDVPANTPGEFLTQGIVTIGKTSALQINVGDVVYWDAGNKVVNKTTSSQRGIGICVEAALNPSPTVVIRLGVNSVAGT